MSDSCAYNPGLQAQQGALPEGGDGSRPIEEFVALPGVTPSNSTLAYVTTIHTPR